MILPDSLRTLHEERLRALEAPKWSNVRAALAGSSVHEKAKALIPWKKGPFALPGFTIDGEWDCQRKWNRLARHLGSIEGATVMDVGCNNGWYMGKLREAGAASVIGFDPGPLNLFQWRFIQSLSPDPAQEFYLLGVEHLIALPSTFDITLCLGVLYHHRDPLQQLIDLRDSLKPGGTLFLETIGVPGNDPTAYLPSDRYALMPNVWFLPTLPCLLSMLERTRYADIEVLSTEWDRGDEQRQTAWSEGPSYLNSLDPHNSSLTIEGHPAPQRFLVKASRKRMA